MARFKRLDTLTKMKEAGLVVLFYNDDPRTANEILSACSKAGANIVEFTNRGDMAYPVFKEMEACTRKNFPDLILGIGSIIDAPTAAQYINAGANFIVSPAFDKNVAELCNARKIPYIPGCGTVTEIHNAHISGVEIVKVFPAAEMWAL